MQKENSPFIKTNKTSYFIAKLKENLVDSFRAIFKSKKMLVMFLFGISSGLPLLLVLSSFALWFSDFNITLETIGYITLLTFPYTFKFLWSPLMDNYAPKFLENFLGKHRAWILLTQILLIIIIINLSFFNPKENIQLVCFLIFMLSFVSASQDIMINAYQVNILSEQEKALGSSVYTLGYRMGMFLTGTCTLLIVNISSWSYAIFYSSFFFLIGILGTIIAKPCKSSNLKLGTLRIYIYPIKEFFKRISFKSAILIIILVIFYKLSDALAFALNSVFFKDGLGFTLVEIGFAYKTNAMIASILGTIIGGLIIRQIGLYKGFLYFCLAMSITHLLYAILAIIGKNFYFMSFSVFFEYFASGMGTSAFIAMLLSLCNLNFSATQFALLSSIDSIPRVISGKIAAPIAASYGWETLFIISFVVGLFIFFYIIAIKKHIKLMGNLS